MEGQQFLTVNPDTFTEKELWSYQDLQKLCKSAGIKANQKRDILIDCLQCWHRSRKDGTQTMVETVGEEECGVENIDMNVIGNNFAVLAMDVKPRGCKTTKRKKRGSIVGLGLKDSIVVSPTLLRPLRQNPGTPGKSCLKSSTSLHEKTATPHKLSNICFSPFNGVKVISHRDELEDSPFEYEYDDCDEDYDEIHSPQYS